MFIFSAFFLAVFHAGLTKMCVSAGLAEKAGY